MHVNLGNTVRREKSAVNPVEEEEEPSTTLVDGLVADNSSEIVRTKKDCIVYTPSAAVSCCRTKRDYC